jgi:hypothetical protein
MKINITNNDKIIGQVKVDFEKFFLGVMKVKIKSCIDELEVLLTTKDLTELEMLNILRIVTEDLFMQPVENHIYRSYEFTNINFIVMIDLVSYHIKFN